MTTYDIGGVQLAENSAQAIMTQYTPQGAIVYNCQLGADAVYAFARFCEYQKLALTLCPSRSANCAVQQLYDGAAYSYAEPITYFGQSTGALPAAAAAATSSVDPAATPAATTSPSSSSAPARIVPSSSSTSTRAPSATNGPQTGAVQATSSNVFGGNAAAQDGGASSRAALTKTAGALVAVMAGVAAFL